MRNVLTVLEAAGATKDDVAKLTIYLHKDLTGEEGYGAVMPVWGKHADRGHRGAGRVVRAARRRLRDRRGGLARLETWTSFQKAT